MSGKRELTPRSLEHQKGDSIDATIYTDGYYPDARKNESEEPRIGAVIFTMDQARPVATTIEVPKEIVDM